MTYVVILSDQHGRPLPLSTDEEMGYMATFATIEEAREAGETNLLGRVCGYEVKEWNKGETP